MQLKSVVSLLGRWLPWLSPTDAGGAEVDAAVSRRTNNKMKVATSLAAATCSLLGAGTEPSLAADGGGKGEKQWSFDAAVMYYGEQDRVQDASLSLLARRLWGNGRGLTFGLTFDTLTGPSASGAAPATTPQTFTTPSGESSYTTVAGETPLDPTFHDTRVALTANWERPVGLRSRIELGASASSEFDYFHVRINGRYSRDFNQRNTTLTLGLALAADSIDPEGGAPIPLAPMLPVGDLSNKEGADSKAVADLMVGVAQVFGRRTLAQFNYSLSHASGYLTDPYKLVSVLDPVTGDQVPSANSGLNLYLFESRPDSRTKHSFYTELRHHLSRDIVNVSYRFMTDDWGVDSHTVDLRYRWKRKTFYIQPHLRYYMQGQADFHVFNLFDGDPLPRHATADYRLGELDAYTFGVKYGRPTGNGREWGLRIEYYSQSGTSPPGSDVGSLAGLEVTPGVSALIFQAGYRF